MNKVNIWAIVKIALILSGCDSSDSGTSINDVDAIIDEGLIDNCSVHLSHGELYQSDVLICNEGFVIGYSLELKNPEWAAYKLTAESVNGYYPRSNEFIIDARIEQNKQSHPDSFQNTGFDRGHLVASATVDFNEDSMLSSFLMTNITPQLASFNRGIWLDIESRVRDCAYVLNEIYVYSGALYNGNSTVGNNTAIATDFYVILLNSNGETINSEAYLIPHSEYYEYNLKDFKVTIGELENEIGYPLNIKNSEVISECIA